MKCTICGLEVGMNEQHLCPGNQDNQYKGNYSNNLHSDTVMQQNRDLLRQMSELETENGLLKKALEIASKLLEDKNGCPTIEHVTTDCDDIECSTCWVEYLIAKAKEQK